MYPEYLLEEYGTKSQEEIEVSQRSRVPPRISRRPPPIAIPRIRFRLVSRNLKNQRKDNLSNKKLYRRRLISHSLKSAPARVETAHLRRKFLRAT